MHQSQNRDRQHHQTQRCRCNHFAQPAGRRNRARQMQPAPDEGQREQQAGRGHIQNSAENPADQLFERQVVWDLHQPVEHERLQRTAQQGPEQRRRRKRRVLPAAKQANHAGFQHCHHQGVRRARGYGRPECHQNGADGTQPRSVTSRDHQVQHAPAEQLYARQQRDVEVVQQPAEQARHQGRRQSIAGRGRLSRLGRLRALVARVPHNDYFGLNRPCLRLVWDYKPNPADTRPVRTLGAEVHPARSRRRQSPPARGGSAQWRPQSGQ